MSDAEALKRLVYWANRDGALARRLVEQGYEIVTVFHAPSALERAARREGYNELFVYRDKELLALIHDFGDECFLFLWTPEARPSRWRRWLWSLRHLRMALKPQAA